MTHSLSCLPFCRIWAPTSSLLAMSSSEDPSSCARAFTVQGPRMAEAMVKGLKRVESRPRPLFAPGWYFLHKGKKTGFDEEYAQELQSLLPEHSSGSMPEHSSGSMPEVAVEDACSTGAIVGMVCIGKQLRHSDLPNHQWVQESRPVVYEITKCMQFAAGVPLAGQQGVWHVRMPEVQGKLRKAISQGTLHTWPDQFPSLSDTRKRSQPQKAKSQASRPWPKPLPRKRRSDAGTHQCPPDLVSSSKRQRIQLGDPAVGAKRPARPPADASSSSSAPTRHEEQSLVQRISAGRTLPRLLELMDMTFFNIQSPRKAGKKKKSCCTANPMKSLGVD